MTIAYIRAATIIEQSHIINEMNDLETCEIHIEPISGHLKKEIFDKLLDNRFDKLLLKNLESLPLTSNKAIDFLSFLHRQKIEITLLDSPIDIKTILELEKLNRANSKITKKVLLK